MILDAHNIVSHTSNAYKVFTNIAVFFACIVTYRHVMSNVIEVRNIISNNMETKKMSLNISEYSRIVNDFDKRIKMFSFEDIFLCYFHGSYS